MLRFLRLRYLALAVLIYYGAGYFGYGPGASHDDRLRAALATFGYPDASFKIAESSAFSVRAQEIVLDFDPDTRDPINTIESLTLNYGWWGMITGSPQKIIMYRPDLFWSAENLPPLGFIFDPATWSLATFRANDIEINDINLSYAGEDFNPSLSGKFVLNTAEDGAKRATLTLQGEQKDLQTDVQISITENTDGTRNVRIDVPEFRLDIPGQVKLARTHAKLNLDLTKGQILPVGSGEFMAGVMRMGGTAFDDTALTLQSNGTNFSATGNATVNGLPLTNLSLRLTGAPQESRALLQINGESPSGLMARLGSKAAWPTQQKFSLLLDLQERRLGDLFLPPWQGSLFLYDNGEKPLLRAQVACPDIPSGCTLQLPQTALATDALNKFLAPYLAERGLAIAGGRVDLRGTIKGWGGNNAKTPIHLEGRLVNSQVSWQGLKLANFSTNFVWQPGQLWQMGQISGAALGGQITGASIKIEPSKKTGQATVNAQNIDLTDLARFMRIKGLDLTGRADATIKASLANGRVIINPGTVLRAKNGNIAYSPKTWPDYLAGSDARRKTLRTVLGDYNFTNLALTFLSGTGGMITGEMTAQGTNTALFGDRPVQINLDIKETLAPPLARLGTWGE